MSAAPVRVLVVDDSTTARALLVHLFDSDPDMDVVGEATNGEEAIAMTKELTPSVVVMDIEMPVLDGLEATKRIMIEQPTPIVIVAGSTDPRDVEVSLHAVRVGALTVLPKPVGPGSPTFDREGRRLVALVKAFADVRVVRRRWTHLVTDPPAGPPVVATPPGPARSIAAVGVAASTGGPAALYRLLEDLPPEIDVPILVVQHIAPGFVRGLVSWLGSGTALPVKAAEHGEPLRGGTVYVAPDGAHLEVNASRRVHLDGGPPLGGFQPAATCLFQSLARSYGASAAAVVLTGMGHDGLEGARELREAGGLVLAQDEKSSVVFGMPRAVVAAGLAHRVGPVDDLALSIAQAVPMRRG